MLSNTAFNDAKKKRIKYIYIYLYVCERETAYLSLNCLLGICEVHLGGRPKGGRKSPLKKVIVVSVLVCNVRDVEGLRKTQKLTFL